MDSKYAYFFLRLPIAMSMLGHGLVRLPKLETFAQGMVTQFSESMLPAALVYPFGLAVPVIELVLGILLLLGLFTRSSLYAGLLLMTVLIFGTAMIENWTGITSQLVHSLYFALVLIMLPHDRFSLDYMRHSR